MAIQKVRSGSKFYDNALRMTYNYTLHDFGAGAGAFEVKPPHGCNMGRLVEIEVNVQETFTQDTTKGEVVVGNSNDDDLYGTLSMGTDAVAGEVFNSADDDIFSATGANGTGLIDMTRDGASGVAIDDVLIGFVSPTGGTPAGKGEVHIVIEWF